MKRRFEYDFDDESHRGQLSFELSGKERLATAVEEHGTSIFVNREACAVLARIFAKMALSSYPDGFHVHLQRDLDPDDQTGDVLTILLNETTQK